MSTPQLSKRDSVHVLDIGDTENRLSPEWMEEFGAALDEVLSEPAPLVVTATGKFYSNGLDLDWLGRNPNQFLAYVTRVQALFARVLTLPVPTATAINGHAFGAGAMLAMAFDWRVMRDDRGFFCFPEVDISIPFTPGMAALIQSKVTPRAAVDSMTTGRRFSGADAVAVGLVDHAVTESDLVDRAVERVVPLAGKSTETLGKIKSTMFAEAVTALTEVGAV
ncbi:enoyl-CoA hydratase/isomerase family protein [Williamsia sterculiae]|uniref:enoyl-CoA hydratase/isomerase family protein n=1 Tax=Williamsia sterculiae TaxID=1344003 RepID=UPI0009F9091A|nr:enoyl-CoA hydratase/isomerase family protein [Williamsia sterculiae]